MQTIANALIQCVIRTTSGWTIKRACGSGMVSGDETKKNRQAA
jgi:hypothetical protein